MKFLPPSILAILTRLDTLLNPHANMGKIRYPRRKPDGHLAIKLKRILEII